MSDFTEVVHQLVHQPKQVKDKSGYTEDEIIFAYQQIGLGRDAADVFVELTGNDEYAELGAAILLELVRSWYKRQTPQRLMELAGMPMLEVGA